MKSIWRFVLCLGLVGNLAAQETIKVPLAPMALTNTGVVLSASSFNAQDKDAPIVYYIAFGSEVILPKNALVFSGKSPKQTLQIGDTACEVEYLNGNFAMKVGGKEEVLNDGADLGYQSVRVPQGGAAPYTLAIPRAFAYKNEGRMFCRSGAVQAGTVDGVELRLYDDDMDGRYKKGQDGVSIGDRGGMGIFGTLSELLPTPKAVYAIKDVASDGTSVTLGKYTGPTGRMKLEPGVSDVECRLAFASEDGKCSFGTMASGQGSTLTLPAGKYRFLYGYVYRPAIRHVVCVVLPSGNVPVTVEKDEEVKLTLGDLAKREWPWGDGMVTMTFEQVIGLDLLGVEEACSAGDFAKGQKLLDEVAGKYRSGPNYDVSRLWMEELRQRLALETSSEGAALHEAEGKLMAAVKEGKLDAAKALLPEVRNALARIPAKSVGSWPCKVHRLLVGTMAGFAEGTSKPGLKVTTTDHGMRPNPKIAPEVVQTVDWPPPKPASPQFFGKIYEGFLLVPEDGDYELALESSTGARMAIDGKMVIDHWIHHTASEKTAKVKLTAGAHPLKIEMYTNLGTFCLHFRWTPPGGRKAVVPEWAFMYK